MIAITTVRAGGGASGVFLIACGAVGFAYVMNRLDFDLTDRSAREAAAGCGVPRRP